MEKVIEKLVGRAGNSNDACQALQFTQAALNAANAMRVMAEAPRPKAIALNDDQIKHMVNRFLGWKLPDSFNPDGGISFKKTFNEHTTHPIKREPSGTNLFDATQADAMVRYMIEGMRGTTRTMQPPNADN